MNTSVITPSEVAAINAARTALEAVTDRNYQTALQGAAALAANSLFSVLNIANAYLDADLTQEELHNKPADEIAAARAEVTA